MTVVMVHGNPETAAVWNALVDALAARGCSDIVRLSPPGFGAPAPQGWNPHVNAYRDWLVDQLEQLDGPIDLVGHDMGAAYVHGVRDVRPDLVRSCVIDGCGAMSPDYVLHDMAEAWATPERGERLMAALLRQPIPERQAIYEGYGIGSAAAAEIAEAMNEDMGRCILGIYRSLIPTLGDIALRLDGVTALPVLAIDATGDHFVPPELNTDMARRLGTEMLTLEGHGHWWMWTATDQAADGLIEFWQQAGQERERT